MQQICIFGTNCDTFALMKKLRKHIALRNLSVGMAMFMLLGQFAFFNLHLHLDRDNHNSNRSEKSFVCEQSYTHDVNLTNGIEDDFHCEVCDLYLNKKIETPTSYFFTFQKDESKVHTKHLESLVLYTYYFSPLRAPPCKYA